ncbi:MAG: hypothetical protein ACPL07_03665 [Candidatus Bathyarchaeia archaeon]
MDSTVRIDAVGGWLRVSGMDDNNVYAFVVVMGRHIVASYVLRRLVVRDAHKDLAVDILKKVNVKYAQIVEALHAKGFKKYWLIIGRVRGHLEIFFTSEEKLEVAKEEIEAHLPAGCKVAELHSGYKTWGEIVCS